MNTKPMIRTEEDDFFQTIYLQETPELRQRIFDEYAEARQALDRAMMAGAGAEDEIAEAHLRVDRAWRAKHEIETYHELTVEMLGEEYYTEYWKEA